MIFMSYSLIVDLFFYLAFVNFAKIEGAATEKTKKVSQIKQNDWIAIMC